MGETGASRVPGNLDPSAQEFRPSNHPYLQNQMPFFIPTQICYPYPSTEHQLMPFSEGPVAYPHFPASPLYAGPVVGNSCLSPPAWQLSATPTRTLLLSSVPAEVSEEATVRRELEAFGEVRTVQTERACDGIVAVSFYDLRHAQAGLTEIREQHMQQQSRLRKHYDSLSTQNLASQVENFPAPQPPPARGLIAGRAVWAQFMMPPAGSSPDGHNQGTIVIFNLDLEVSTNNLRDIFETFGPIKELRETPLKPHQRFVEFFDIRDAARARREMNGKEIQGKRVAIEFSRPGGHGKRFLNNGAIDSISTTLTSSSSSPTRVVIPFHHKINHPTCPPTLPRKASEKSSPSNMPPRSYPSQTRSSTKKSSNVGINKMNKRSSNVGTLFEASMASLCLTSTTTTGSVVNGIEDSNGVPKQNPKNTPNNSSTAKQQQQQALRNQMWKERQKNFNSRFLINEDALAESHFKDSRTTVMIKNIPNKYSQKLLMNMLDNHCLHCNEGEQQPLSSYDFLYLPIDFNNKCNVGYGFVNMTSPQATVRLYKAFHLQSWEVFNSTKICEITYARVQGLEALKEHFRNSKFLCETKAYLPVVFSPPRDGRQLTEPQPIAGHNGTITKASDDDEDDDGGHRLNINGDDEDDIADYDDQPQNGDDEDDDSICVAA